ncbi:hypothetical protein [Leptospira bourretii]|uniref:hypothetical protein n=1 Tax=Leptospira bourretii TaxID=2484962 RepID=UPI0014386736|nr:hypothetical protein [Leptospira bourretii]
MDPSAILVQPTNSKEKYWELEVKSLNGEVKKYLEWDLKGILQVEVIINGNSKYSKLYYENGNVKEEGNYIYTSVFDEASNTTEVEYAPFGKWIEYFDNGKVKSVSCHTPDYREDIGSNCEIKYQFSSSGKLLNKIDYKRKCKLECK